MGQLGRGGLGEHSRVRPPRDLPPELRDRPFSVAAARELGVPVARLAARDLARPYKGVRVPVGGDATAHAIVRRARALTPLLLPGQYFSHTTAAALLGMRLPRRFDEDVLHVTSTSGRRAPRRTGVAGHRSTCPPIQNRGLPVSGPVETWLHCAELLTGRDLVVMGDGLVARCRPVATVDDLALAIDEHVRLGGVTRLRDALARIRPRTDSAMETLLRLAVVGARLPEPAVNLPIRDASGHVCAYADLAWEAERVILEYDGDHHRSDRAQFSSDIERVGRLQQLGWLVIRVDAALFHNLPALISRLTAALTTRRQGLR